MSVNARALAQANQGLEEAASLLKRTQNQTRRALQQIRQAQMQMKGVEVIDATETPEPLQGGTGHVDINTHAG